SAVSPAALLCPRRSPCTLVFDGTTISMPDTSENQACWPQSGAERAGVGFPVMRIVGLFDPATGAWIGMARGTFAGSKRGSERTLWDRLWKHLRAGDTGCRRRRLLRLVQRGPAPSRATGWWEGVPTGRRQRQVGKGSPGSSAAHRIAGSNENPSADVERP